MTTTTAPAAPTVFDVYQALVNQINADHGRDGGNRPIEAGGRIIGWTPDTRVITFGYLGNCGHWGDDRTWYVWFPGTDRSVCLGATSTVEAQGTARYAEVVALATELGLL